MSQERPDPDLLLAQVQAEDEQHSRGRLRIFFGAAPGVGKTYAMLEAARREAAAEVDLVIGYVEAHARPETQALLPGLELLPRRKVEYRGTALEEFDLEKALERHPRILILDELAHTNAPGSTHAKRWRDVEQLLAAGIDVYTTLNVQHLESLNDVIARITGVVVRETIPDRIFDDAHEVELVDLPPDELIERLHEGKVYVSGQAAWALENFFRKGNLIALRELALRRTAEQVGVQVRDYRQAHAISSTWPTNEELLVCVSPSPLAGRLVRAGKRMAASLHTRWTVVYVETPATAGLRGIAHERLQRHLQLAERLGAQTVTLSGSRALDELLHYARRHNVTKVLVGKPLEPRWKEFLRGSFVYQLIRNCGDLDVYVISGERSGEEVAPGRLAGGRTSALPYLWAAMIVATCTFAAWLLFPRLAPVNVVMVYLLGLVAVSLWFGHGPSILASISSVAAFDFFFVPPRFSFAVSDTEYLITFGVMLATGLVISTLTGRVKAQIELTREREQRTASLYALGRELSARLTVEDVVRSVILNTAAALDAEVIVLLPDPAQHLAVQPAPAGFDPSAQDLAAAQWVSQNGRTAGLGTETLPTASALYLPLTDAGQTIGVLGLRPH